MVAKNKINTGAAERAVSFISLLKHSQGEFASQPFHLMDWQRERIIEPLFGSLNKDGTRQYRTCYVEIPRKNGKTELGAAVGLYLLYADDEPGAQIYSAAGDRQQASLIYNAAVPMVRQAPALTKRSRIIESQKRISVYSTNSYYQVLSSESYSKHGINAHGVLFDELHTQPDSDLWDVLTTSQGSRRQPLIFVMTTAGYDRNSIAYKIHDYALKVQNGIIDDPTFLPVIYGAPEDADWTDEDVWRACNPALGEFRSMEEMRMFCKQAQEIPIKEMAFRRLYLNQWVNSAERWLPMDKWDECNEPVNPDSLKGRPCYAGLDLSSTTDLTALALVFPDGSGSYDILMHFWIPKDTAAEKEHRDRVPYQLWERQGYITLTDGNVIDYKYILQTLIEYRKKYDIREIAFDRWGATKLSQDLTDNDFLMVPFGQGFASMSAPTKELMNLVLGRKIRHGNNPVLRWNADNLVVNQDPAGNLKPDKAKATQKIDGMVAVIMAIDRATRHGDSDRSIYEVQEVQTF
ncbi:MAG: terminase large subunit [Dehalococcoidales bacterium]|nr:terminase large subunit [Dehalococcoidales bacterium]